MNLSIDPMDLIGYLIGYLVPMIVIIIWTLTRKPSPGSTKQRDMWSGLAAWFIGPFGFWIKRRWRDGFKWLGIWLLICLLLMGSSALICAFMPDDPPLTDIAALALFAALIAAWIGLVIVTVIQVVRARIGAEPEPPPTPTDLTVAKPRLHDLGECEVKHGVRVHLVNLYTDEVGNRAPPEKLKRARVRCTVEVGTEQAEVEAEGGARRKGRARRRKPAGGHAMTRPTILSPE